jgi:hypothetical protein
MKKMGIIFCGCVMICLAVLAADKKQSTQADANVSVEQLTRQIDSLQTKLKEMEKRLAKLEQTKSDTVIRFSPQTIIPPVIQNQHPGLESFADPSHPPKIWGEGAFNGWKYYTIPLSFSGSAAATPSSMFEDLGANLSK